MVFHARRPLSRFRLQRARMGTRERLGWLEWEQVQGIPEEVLQGRAGSVEEGRLGAYD
jgi:hypothetical protein